MTVVEKQVPLLDLGAQHRQIREEVLAEIVRVVDSQKFIMGEDVKKLEQDIAPYCGCKHAIGCASGSDAASSSACGVVFWTGSPSGASRQH